MITKKSIIVSIENILRQQAEEKPHLLIPGKEKQFYNEIRTKVVKNDFLNVEYVRDWVMGYRARKK